MIECPNHKGSFDCTPFCEKCNGEQDKRGKVMSKYEAVINVSVEVDAKTQRWLTK